VTDTGGEGGGADDAGSRAGPCRECRRAGHSGQLAGSLHAVPCRRGRGGGDSECQLSGRTDVPDTQRTSMMRGSGKAAVGHKATFPRLP